MVICLDHTGRLGGNWSALCRSVLSPQSSVAGGSVINNRYNNKMTSEVSGGAKDSENNSIIESEILDEVESGSGSVSIEERTDVVTPSVKDTVSEVTENYSEEFENYNDDEEEEEQIEESVVESDKEVTVEEVEEEEENTVASSSKSSTSSSDSIKIRCEINISNSAVKSDQESVEADNLQFTMEDEIRSWTPSDYNDESHLFDMGVLNESMVNLLLMEDRKMQRERQRMKYKNGTRMSLSFTNERMREIERHNQILVRKIFQAASPQVMVSTY